MELMDELDEGKKKVINKGHLEKDNLQYNCQDMDQEQEVDVNPVQFNNQNLHIYICDDKDSYSGKITGTTYLGKNKEIIPDVDIELFFGNESKLPVYKTNSDNNGNFVIEDIPPGYYTLTAASGSKLKYRSHYIKVFPGKIVNQSILLTK